LSWRLVKRPGAEGWAEPGFLRLEQEYI
jgi:hypothetical protein